jgi:hypothetical protein
MSHIGFLKPAKNKKNDTNSISNIIEPRFTHASITGETGCGKTSAMINPNLNHRLSLGHGMLIYDHKGNYHQTVKALAKRHGRLKDVVMIGVPWGRKCNIIEDMDETTLTDFIRNIVRHSKDNKYWEDSAVDLAMPILKVLKAIEALDKFEIFQDVTQEIIHKNGYGYNLSSLYNITTHRNNIKRFNIKLSGLYLKNILSTIEQLVRTVDETDNEHAKEMLGAYIHFEKVYETFENKIMNSAFMKEINSHKNTLDSIIISLNTPLGSLANHSYINTSNINIVKALNEGKIVIFLCNQLPETVLASITSSILNHLHERIGQEQLKDITVFIDEAQRVLNDNIDLPIDTLREARVEIIMAYQSNSLLTDRIGIIKTSSLLTNLTTRYYLKSNCNDDDIDTSSLSPFEFKTNLDNAKSTNKAQPMFIDKDELFEAEYAYQKIIKAFEPYRSSLPLRKGRKYILKFVPSLHTKDILPIIYKNGKEENFKIKKPFPLNEYNLLKMRLSSSLFLKDEVKEDRE